MDTHDGDFLDLDWLDAPPEVPHVLVLHGLEGSPESGYVRATLNAIARKGWGAVAMAWRSCSGEPNRVLRSYCSGETEDPLMVCRRIRAAGVQGPLFAIGYSLGANALLKLLAETGDDAPLDAAVAVSTPFDLAACARALDAPWSGGAIYRRKFLKTLRQKALEKLREHPASGLSPDGVRRARTLRAFDDAFTAPSNGYRDADDYYARASSGPLLGPHPPPGAVHQRRGRPDDSRGDAAPLHPRAVRAAAPHRARRPRGLPLRQPAPAALLGRVPGRRVPRPPRRAEARASHRRAARKQPWTWSSTSPQACMKA